VVAEVVEIDADRVMVLMSGRIRGRSSGVTLEDQVVVAVVTVRDRKIVRSEGYPSREQALEAVRLEG
jgi:ketosteroid isomerase-like protein